MLAVNVTELPEQIEVEPDALMVAVGKLQTVTAVGELTAGTPFVVTVTV